MVQRATEYAKSGRVNIAYQVVGEGPTDLVLVPGFVSHVELAWEEPRLAHLLTGWQLSRGWSSSTSAVRACPIRSSAPTMGERMDDIRAVMDAAGSAGAHCSGFPRAAPSPCCSRMITLSGRGR